MVDSLRVTVARARPITSRSLAKPSMSTRRTANKARDRARHHVVNWRRSSAYASLVRPRYPATNPARVIRSASVKTGWIVASAADGTAVIIGHLPARLKPGSWARPGPSGSTEPQRKPPDYVTLCQARIERHGAAGTPRNTPYRRIFVRPDNLSVRITQARINQLCSEAAATKHYMGVEV